MTIQVDNLNEFLAWVESCPHDFTISSMNGSYIHVRFLIPVTDLEEESQDA